MTNDEFDFILIEIINESPASHLLFIPGIYEILSEHFNNDILNHYYSTKKEKK